MFGPDAYSMTSLACDRNTIASLQSLQSYVDFHGKIPKRCLDLGCGVRPQFHLLCQSHADLVFRQEIGY